MDAAHPAPIILEQMTDALEATVLERLPSRPRDKTEVNSVYKEDLIQRLVDEYPSILPVKEIEPVFSNLKAICRELPLVEHDRETFVDNLLINAAGRICIIECKLWRNGEAEREAIAQILHYAGQMSRLSYEQLNAAVQRARRTVGKDPIFQQVFPNGADDQTRGDFTDAVARSLSRGEFLLLLIGDYVRPGVRGISEYFQRYSGLGFAFGLIEMAIYRRQGTDGPFYIQPRVVARTEIIKRTVFVTNTDRPTSPILEVDPPKKPTTITEEDFFNNISEVDPSYPTQLRAFLDKCRDRGCVPNLLKTYVLHVDEPNGGRLNLGTISKSGSVGFWGMATRDAEYGEAVGRRYMETIVEFLGDAEIKDDNPDPGFWHVRYKGRASIPLKMMLRHEEKWLTAISAVVDAFARLTAD